MNIINIALPLSQPLHITQNFLPFIVNTIKCYRIIAEKWIYFYAQYVLLLVGGQLMLNSVSLNDYKLKFFNYLGTFKSLFIWGPLNLVVPISSWYRN